MVNIVMFVVEMAVVVVEVVVVTEVAVLAVIVVNIDCLGCVREEWLEIV